MLYTQNEFLTFSLLSFSLFRPCKKKELKSCISCKNCKKTRHKQRQQLYSKVVVVGHFVVVAFVLIAMGLFVHLNFTFFVFGYLERERALTH